MHSFHRKKPLQNSPSDCAAMATMGERELAAFFRAVTELFGPEQAKLAAEDWFDEFSQCPSLPASPREWREVTARASARLAGWVEFSLGFADPTDAKLESKLDRLWKYLSQPLLPKVACRE
jgi:hypothetical protein